MATEEDMTDFVLTYDGPELSSRSMPVRDLAPALLALGELFQEANALTEPAGSPVSLEVKAFDHGSFAIDLHVAREVMDLLGRPGVQQAGLLIGMLTDVSTGLFAFMRWLRNGKVVSRTDQGDGNIAIGDNHGNIFIMPNAVSNIYDNPRARSLAREVVKPLKQPGIDEMRVKRPNKEPLVIRRDETEAFDAPIPEEVLSDNTVTLRVTVLDAVFARGNKWRFGAGDATPFWAAIEDDGFWDRVETRNDLFGFGDVLEVRMSMRQTRDSTGALNMKRTIVEVLDHLRGGGGMTPPLSTESDANPAQGDSH